MGEVVLFRPKDAEAPVTRLRCTTMNGLTPCPGPIVRLSCGWHGCRGCGYVYTSSSLAEIIVPTEAPFRFVEENIIA